jgi:hypothetical protein
VVHEGVTIFENTGHIPDPFELQTRDPRWIVDLNRAMRVKRYAQEFLDTDHE